MFDSFDTVSLGRDGIDNVVVECPVVAPTQPSQIEKEVLQHEDEHHENRNDTGMEVEDAEVDVPPHVEDVVQEEPQPEPLVVILPIQAEQPSNSEAEAPPPVVEDEIEPEHQFGRATEDPCEHTEMEPDPINIQMPLLLEDQSGRTTEDVAEHTELDPKSINIPLEPEPELTLRPWLHPEAETSAATGTTESAEDMITGVLLSMNQEDQGQEGNQKIKINAIPQ
ncbi:hypothetical protein PIB30_055790 [Stylosanthes scabra]|uniref:Uncharacterized protein n=1 Tax=Stylosanthes scabra TaxID=79078 RepID=A0ABU6ZHV2_9FABA|nr:hypothetical protein [Stylosanthes scabra]